MGLTALLALALACTPATGAARQRITVDTPSAAATTASLRLWRRSGSCWLPAAGPWPARVGRNGVSAHHREGDGTTPIGTFGIGPAMYGSKHDPGVRYRYHRIVCGDWWSEDADSPTYNTFQHVRCGTRPPFRAESEGLWKPTAAYGHFAVIDYNAHPAVPGRGSAIFLHVGTGGPTNGCVSLAYPRLRQVLRWLRPGDAPEIVIGS